MLIFNEINSSTSEITPTKLTLADMINKTLTTIPPKSPTESFNKINKGDNWSIEKSDEMKGSKTNGHVSSSKINESFL